MTFRRYCPILALCFTRLVYPYSLSLFLKSVKRRVSSGYKVMPFKTALLRPAAVVVALVSRVHFFRSPGIELADTSDSPPNALERKLLWFTYKEPDFLYILPSLLLALASLAVGVSAFQMEDTDYHAAGVLLILSSVGVLAGNAQKSYVARFTGNFAEVVMLWSLFVAECYVIWIVIGTSLRSRVFLSVAMCIIKHIYLYKDRFACRRYHGHLVVILIFSMMEDHAQSNRHSVHSTLAEVFASLCPISFQNSGISCPHE